MTKPKVKVKIVGDSIIFTLPMIKTRKGTNSKSTKVHKDKRRKVKHKHREKENESTS